MSGPCYLDNGQEVEVLARTDDGETVVRPIYEREDEEPRLGRPFTVREVFATPPVAKFHAECERLALESADHRAKITEARQEWEAWGRGEKERKDRVQRHDALRLLDDFIAGRITHVVSEGSYGPPKISTFADFIADRDARGRGDGFKLLSLFGRSNGALHWGVNRYYDGSGSNTTVHPARSVEEAMEIAERLWGAAMEAFREKEGYMHGFNYWVDAAPALGLDLPQDLAIRWFAHVASAADDAVAKATEELAAKRQAALSARAAIAKATGQSEAAEPPPGFEQWGRT